MQPLWKTVGLHLKTLNTLLPLYPPSTLRGICPGELKTFIYTKTHTQMFIATDIHNCENFKATKHPSVGESMKLWYIQTMNYYLTLKTNELSSPKKSWKNLKCILLSERRQFKKAMYYMHLTICRF